MSKNATTTEWIARAKARLWYGARVMGWLLIGMALTPLVTIILPVGFMLERMDAAKKRAETLKNSRRNTPNTRDAQTPARPAERNHGHSEARDEGLPEGGRRFGRERDKRRGGRYGKQWHGRQH